MAITEAELGKRLKQAREACGRTQAEVAEALGIPRTAVTQMESGDRLVKSTELHEMARLYARGVGELLSEEEFSESPLTALFRANVAEEHVLREDVPRIMSLCTEAVSLERLLGRDTARTPLVQYDPAPPSTRWDAIMQGRQIAELERRRLGLGDAPAWEIAEIVKRQGIRVVEAELAQDVSGLFIHSRDIGSVIIVNRKDGESRKLFSCAHEYCHALVDRGKGLTISRRENLTDLVEIRANSFAAFFLMPEEGVRRYLDQMGKGPESRLVHQVYGWAGTGGDVESVAAQKRAVSGRRDLLLHDVVILADHFGVSFEAALYHLLNLKLLHQSTFDKLKAGKTDVPNVRRALDLRDRAPGMWLLNSQVLELGFEAYRRDLISRGKLRHVASQVNVDAAVVEAVLEAEGLEEEPVAPALGE